MSLILHIGEVDKFTAPLFKFLRDKNVELKHHNFLCRFWRTEWPYEIEAVLIKKTGLSWMLSFIVEACKADKIIIHGLFDSRVLFLLFMQPWLLKKCYWIIWGGDLYVHESLSKDFVWYIKDFLRRPIIKRMGSLVTYISGDVELARKWYGAKGRYLECIMYPSNLYRNQSLDVERKGTINIQVGNSACKENNHLEILERLARYSTTDIAVYVPLSYGDNLYAKKVINKGLELFGDKFKPMMKFLSADEYTEHLNNMDLAIFNHNRQQGMGNMIALVGLGKKVYLRPGLSSSNFFNAIGVHIYDVSHLDLDRISISLSEENINIIASRFSENILLAQLNHIFNDC